MKKFLKSVLCALLVLSSFLPVLLNINFSEKAIAITSEDSISNKFDIVGTSYNDMTSNLREDATQGQTPFDSSNGKVMYGYSITPRTSEYNQFDRSYSVSQFTINDRESIFMWIYFPDDPYVNFYSLELSFESQQGARISWHFTPYELSALMDNNYSNDFGWKLLELSYLDAEKTASVNDSTVFFTFRGIYRFITSDHLGEIGSNFNKYLTNGTMSFYHIYRGNRTSTKTTILLEQNYIYYGINQNFLSELDGIYLNEKYKFKSYKDMFSYVYVGKYNLFLDGRDNNRFEWNYTIVDRLNESIVYENETYSFETAGEVTFKVTLKENRAVRNVSQSDHTQYTLIDFKKVLYIHDYIYGNFSKSFYDVIGDNRYKITFSVSDGFELTDNLNISSSNEKIFIVESFDFNENTKVCEIIIKGKKNGRTNLMVSSAGIRPGENKVKSYTVEATIEVSELSNSGAWLQTLYIVLVVYLVGLLIFGFFTYRNIRKNRQKQNRQ